MPIETVTVQMRRAHREPTWGFRLQGGQEYNEPLKISKVVEGSLADRAGLKDDDRVQKIAHQIASNLSHNDAQQTIVNAANYLDLVVERNVSTIFSPEFPTVPGVQVKTVHIGGPPASTTTASQDSGHLYKKSSTYHSKTTSPGYTSFSSEPVAKPYTQSPAPFSAPSAVSDLSSSFTRKTTLHESGAGHQRAPSPRHLSPVLYMPPLGSPGAGRPRSPALNYLQKTGGLFGIDPHLHVPANEEPSYMKSETLKLIQEERKSGYSPVPVPVSPVVRHVEAPPPASAPHIALPPVCENCGQKILGVFCKAGGKTLHGECFNCSTCGNSLKNVGYFSVNDKLYCELHAKQQQGNQFKATPPVDPNLFATYGTQHTKSPRSAEPVRAPYKADVLKQGRVETYSKSTISQARTTSPVPRTYSPTPFSSNVSAKANQFSTAAGDAVQIFGPRTPGRAKGILKQLQDGPRIPLCEACNHEIRGPFVLALGKSWCPEHFICSTPSCKRQLLDIGFIEHNNNIHCEFCYEKLYAPTCSKCQTTILGDCLTALNKRWHPNCFTCSHCHNPFGNASFFLENGQPYCENDWNGLFTTTCNACQFPIEAGDRWVEALDNSYHSDCFCCTVCQKTLEGQSFYAKGGRPYCKAHA